MPALKDQSGTASLSGSHTRWRHLLVAAQLGLSLALLVGAGLFAKTLSNLLTQNPGFIPERLVTFALDPRLSGYNYDSGSQMYRDVVQRLQGLPHVQSVAIAETGPLSTRATRQTFPWRALPPTPRKRPLPNLTPSAPATSIPSGRR